MKKLLLAALAGLAFSCRSGNHFEAESPMPAITMMLPDSSIYKTDQIVEGRYTVIMYFRTDCNHCQQETADILKNSAALGTLNFILLTPKPLKDLRQYAAFFKLADYSNITAATDNKLEFMRYYRPTNVPYLVVYDKRKKLFRICEGPLPIDSLKALVKM